MFGVFFFGHSVAYEVLICSFELCSVVSVFSLIWLCCNYEARYSHYCYWYHYFYFYLAITSISFIIIIIRCFFIRHTFPGLKLCYSSLISKAEACNFATLLKQFFDWTDAFLFAHWQLWLRRWNRSPKVVFDYHIIAILIFMLSVMPHIYILRLLTYASAGLQKWLSESSIPSCWMLLGKRQTY